MPDAPDENPNSRFHSNWRTILKESWAVRVALFWGAVSGLIAVWSAFQDVLPLSVYAALGVLMNASITVARVLKQPGAEIG